MIHIDLNLGDVYLMADFSINEMQEMQKAGKMRTEKQKTGIVWDSHRRTKVKNRKLRGKILSL